MALRPSDPDAAFWLVWCVHGGAPTVKHTNQGSAEREAERLARQHRGSTFVVLQAVESFVSSDVTRTRLSTVDDVPF